MNRNDIILALKDYFQCKADLYDIEMAFLYGSWACGYQKKGSDIDVAVLFSHEMNKEAIFNSLNAISIDLTSLLRHETNVLYIDRELSKPMLYYNAIAHGISIFTKDFTRYVDIRLKAISQMEDFSIFGIRWQSEVARKRLESLKNAGI